MKTQNTDSAKVNLIEYLRSQDNITEEQINVIISKCMIIAKSASFDTTNAMNEAAAITQKYL